MLGSMSALVRVVLLASAMGCDSSATPDSTWTVAQPLPQPTFESYAMTFGGLVYFFGGITGDLGDIATASPSRAVFVYDPATDSWSQGPDLPADAPKHHLSVAVLPDGIYILGGFDGIVAQHPDEPFVPVAKAYALRSGTWVPLAPPPLARGAATAQAIGGKIYVTGGTTTEGVRPFNQLDIYDPVADAWTSGEAMPTAREHLASCALDGKMLVVGGWNEDVSTAVAEEYDPQANSWQTLPPMPTARGGLAAVTEGGQCHAIGGEDWALPFPGTMHAHEVFDPTSGTWTSSAPMPTARHGLGLAVVGRAIYAMGGGPSQGNSYTSVVEVFVP
jgi:N-acetylneuraminic acid mutarotase